MALPTQAVNEQIPEASVKCQRADAKVLPASFADVAGGAPWEPAEPVGTAQTALPAQLEAELGQEQLEEQTEEGRTRRSSLRVRITQDIASGPPEEVLARLARQLENDDARIAAAKVKESEAALHAEEVGRELAEGTAGVLSAMEHEADACERMKGLKRKRAEAAKATAAQKTAFEACQAKLLLLQMEASRQESLREMAAEFTAAQDEKRWKIEELEQAITQSKRAIDEHKQREREARAAMQSLIKETKQISRVGPFGRRQHVSRARQALTNGEAPGTGTGPGEAAGAAAGAQAAAVASDGPARVKREVMTAFPPPRRAQGEAAVITVDDDSQ